ncbi:hypothetical protein DPX16_4544 [Anabarilius grahami]|uniref:Uncharacterized protein n=1 Tax=Anabarilius grahami TaxID=495550 RepID=A0A3N0YCY1_ANAGA|nr:hypothetical protein DPX16_4544 [Anabarilius grahami]
MKECLAVICLTSRVQPDKLQQQPVLNRDSRYCVKSVWVICVQPMLCSSSCTQTKIHPYYITATCACLRTRLLSERKLRCKEKVTEFDELLTSGEIKLLTDHPDRQIDSFSPQSSCNTPI